jgi:hypothetical protein
MRKSKAADRNTTERIATKHDVDEAASQLK